jgi:hypothetical protein
MLSIPDKSSKTRSSLTRWLWEHSIARLCSCISLNRLTDANTHSGLKEILVCCSVRRVPASRFYLRSESISLSMGKADLRPSPHHNGTGGTYQSLWTRPRSPQISQGARQNRVMILGNRLTFSGRLTITPQENKKILHGSWDPQKVL